MAKELANGIIQHPHFEADDFFTHPDGQYVYKPEFTKSAHQLCQLNTLKAMVDGYPKVIVSNTFTQLWELEPYLEMAKTHNYTVDIIECDGRFENVHNVPEDKLKQMEGRFQPLADLDLHHFDVLSERTKNTIKEKVSA